MCGLNISCILRDWFWSLPWWVHWGLLICLVLALWGILARLWSLAKAFGGWQAAVAAVGAAGLILAALFLRRPPVPPTSDDIWPHPDDPKPAPKPKRGKRPTILDRWRR